MKKYLLLTLALLTINCKKDQATSPKTPLKVSTLTFENSNQTWTEKYTYDEQEQVSEVAIDFNVFTKHKAEYDGDRLLAYNTFQSADTVLVGRDSFIYNMDNRLEKILKFTTERDGSLRLLWINEFTYDAFGKVRKQIFYLADRPNEQRTTSFDWKGNNISKRTELDGDGKIEHEFFYTYDNKINYLQNLPNYQHDPVNWGRNNVTKMTYNDYTGLLDLACGPCEQDYNYNLSGYPTRITYNWGRVLTVQYE
ncbi:MAG: hypothetical protein AAGJ18_29890 [Bacteroidota bacterium]